MTLLVAGMLRRWDVEMAKELRANPWVSSPEKENKAPAGKPSSNQEIAALGIPVKTRPRSVN